MNTSYEKLYEPDHSVEPSEYYDPDNEWGSREAPAFSLLFAINTTFRITDKAFDLVERVPGVMALRQEGPYRLKVWAANMFDPQQVAVNVRKTLETYLNRHKKGRAVNV